MISNGSIKGRNICVIGFTIWVQKRHISKIHSLNLKSKLISVTLTQDMLVEIDGNQYFLSADIEISITEE